jgi:hypothetical protein
VNRPANVNRSNVNAGPNVNATPRANVNRPANANTRPAAVNDNKRPVVPRPTPN